MSNQMQQQPYAQPLGGTGDQVPAEVFQQANVYNLGPLVRAFKSTSLAAALGIFIGGVVLDIAVLVALLVFTDRLFIYLLIVPILLIIYLVNAIRSNSHKAYLYQDGFIYTNGSQINTVRWDQVEAVWQKAVSYSWSTRYTYTIKRPDGAQVVVSSHVKNVKELGEVILSEVTKRHLPLAQQAYNSGAPVPFGALYLSLQGIGFKDKLLPWQEVKDVVINNGQVQVKKQGNLITWAAVPAADVPNLPVMLQLVANMLSTMPQMR